MLQTILRNPQQDPIGMDQLRKFSPAVFSKEAHDRVSERYGFIGTYAVLEAMHKAGFVPAEARNYVRRDPANMQFTKHMIRFRHTGPIAKQQVGDVIPQIILINSHDRSSQFELYGGLYRLVCSNGLMVSESNMVSPIVVRHTKTAAEEVVARSIEIAKQHAKVFQHVDAMRKHAMTDRQASQFAKNALALRPERAGIIDPAALLTARRTEDAHRDLWHVMNTIQENLTKGGIAGVTTENRRIRTSEIRSINADVKLNAGIWELAMAAINKAKAK